MAVVAAVVVPGIAMAVRPGAPDPIAVPANLLWRFRLASLSGNLLLWTVITLGWASCGRVGPAHRRVTGAAHTSDRRRAQYSIPLSATMPAS